MSISKKLITLVVGTVSALVVALGVVGYLIISSSGNENALRTLEISQKSTQSAVDAKLEAFTVFARMLEADGELARAVAVNDSAALKTVARRIIGMPGIGQFTVGDMQGVVVVRGHSDKTGDTLSMDRRMVAVPLGEGRSIVGLEPGALIRLSLSAGVPLRYGGRPVGVAIIGEDISDGAFVNTVKATLGVECTIFHGDERVSTTVMQGGKPAINTKLNNQAIFDRVIRQGEVVATRNVIAGSEYDTIYWAWKDVTGSNKGMFFVGLSRAAIVAAQNRVVMYFLLAGAGLGLFLIGVGIFVARAISHPLQRATVYAEQVAGGNFDGRLVVTTKDEVGVLAGALDSMVANLKNRIAESEQKGREAVEQGRKAQEATTEAHKAKESAETGHKAILAAADRIAQVVNGLSAATEQLSTQIEQSSRGTEMQRERVSLSATAMLEMNSTVMEVAKNAGVVAEGSDRARAKATQGAEIVQNSVRSINAVQEDTEKLRKNMENLGRQAESISTIMTVISDIADQTNLLALNAAIEAARAGEAGRGFAVVADEVRKLAEKTMTATKEVGNAINGVQTGTRQSIAAVEQTTGNLNTATGLVKKSGEALAGIVEEVSATAAQISSIATTTEEQSATSEEISHSLEEI
ncbi:MAG: methyl-accepting chemotaxis protein, partial [Desulfovibrio sp.]|nr:methyl-accepting chemotaxis protein [Desulfovibrio sp.]